jgi:hypothetical protein
VGYNYLKEQESAHKQILIDTLASHVLPPMGILCWTILDINRISDIEGSLGIEWMVSYFGLTQLEVRSLLTLLSLWYSYAMHDKTV